MISEKELNYLKSQRIARISTVSQNIQPDVAPVGFELEGGKFVIGSLDMKRTLKYKNIISGNNQVAIVIDDLKSVDPFKPRGVKIHGTAEVVEKEGKFGMGLYIEIAPEKIWSWGIENPSLEKGRAVFNVKDKTGESILEIGEKNAGQK